MSNVTHSAPTRNPSTRCSEGWSGCSRNHRAEVGLVLPAAVPADSIIITDDLIDAGRSLKGGWNARQLAALGVAWPPNRGWRRRLCGQVLPKAKVALFFSRGGQEVPVGLR